MILAQGGDWESRFQITSLTASALAAGHRVDLVLFFAALDAWVADRWDAHQPLAVVDGDHLASLDLPALSSMLPPMGREAEAPSEVTVGAPGGALRVLACSASARLLGLDTAAVQARVDVIAGWPTFHRLIRAAGRVVTL